MGIDSGRLSEQFIQLFGKQPVLYRAPGRVNIIGEHTDYNDGYVMPMNTAVFTWVAAAPRNDRLVRVHSVLFDGTFEFSLDELRPGGVLNQIPQQKPCLGRGPAHDLTGV